MALNFFIFKTKLQSIIIKLFAIKHMKLSNILSDCLCLSFQLCNAHTHGELHSEGRFNRIMAVKVTKDIL